MRTHLITSRDSRIGGQPSGGWPALLTIAALAIAPLTSSGCYAGSRVGHFGDEAFYQRTWQYRVRYDEAPHRLLPERWELVNYETDESGRPTQARLEVTGTVRYPTGRVPHHPRAAFEMAAVDLLFREREGSSRIWVRRAVVPDMDWRARVPDMGRLARLGRRLPRSEPRQRGALVPNIDPRASAQLWMHSFLTRVLSGRDELGPRDPVQISRLSAHGNARVDGEAAYWVQFEGLQDDRLEQITMVGVQPHITRVGWRSRTERTLVVFGFASSPEDHEELRRDFWSLVSRVDLGRAR